MGVIRVFSLVIVLICLFLFTTSLHFESFDSMSKERVSTPKERKRYIGRVKAVPSGDTVVLIELGVFSLFSERSFFCYFLRNNQQ